MIACPPACPLQRHLPLQCSLQCPPGGRQLYLACEVRIPHVLGLLQLLSMANAPVPTHTHGTVSPQALPIREVGTAADCQLTNRSHSHSLRGVELTPPSPLFPTLLRLRLFCLELR